MLTGDPIASPAKRWASRRAQPTLRPRRSDLTVEQVMQEEVAFHDVDAEHRLGEVAGGQNGEDAAPEASVAMII